MDGTQDGHDLEHRTFANPDDVRRLGHGHASIVRLGGGQLLRLVLQPGWRWSVDVGEATGSELCEQPHLWYHETGHLGIRTEDGRELEAGPGELTVLPQSHDAWVVGDQPVVLLDLWGVSTYA